jgi:hypothetical protein
MPDAARSIADPDPECGIDAFFDPGIRDGKKLDPGSAINIQKHIYKSLVTIVWVKNAKRYSCGYAFLTLDPGWKNSDPGSGISIPGHWPDYRYSIIYFTVTSNFLREVI